MNQRTAKLLHDALSAGREIEQYAAGTTREEFLNDRSLQLIFERLCEIVGEALSQAIKEDLAVRTQIPDIMEIIGARYHIAHEYAEVSHPLLWFTATRKIPGMCETLVQTLADVPVGADSD